MKKLFLSMLVMVCTFATASAQTSFTLDGLRYEPSDNTATVYWDNSTQLSGTLAIPGTVTYDGTTYTVVRIGGNGFYNCTGITAVVIPNTVTEIGNQAFWNCSDLTSLSIPSTVTKIWGKATQSCNALETITVDSNNEYYDSRENCNAIIETATQTLIDGCKTSFIPNTVTKIGQGAFDGITGLTSITIPNSVTSIGDYAFYGCVGLTDLYVHAAMGVITLGSGVWGNMTQSNCTLHVRPGYKDWYSQADQWKEFKIVDDIGQALYLRGLNPSWDETVAFTKGEDGKWTVTQEMPADVEFKLTDQDGECWGGPIWHYQIKEEDVTEGTILNLLNGDDGNNFTIPVAGTWTFTVDMECLIMVISGEWKHPYKPIFILGEVNDKDWAANDGVEMTTEDGVIYTADVHFDGRGSSGENYFSFTTELAESEDGWDEIAQSRFGAVSDGDFWFFDTQLGQEIALTDEDGQAIRILAGDYNLTVNFEDWTLVITKKTYLKGDVDGNGTVDVTDVNIVVNIILGKDSADKYGGRADVNGVDGVDVSDVNAIVNIILGKGTE